MALYQSKACVLLAAPISPSECTVVSSGMKRLWTTRVPEQDIAATSATWTGTCCLSALLWGTSSGIFFISEICAQSLSPTNALHRDFQTCKSDWWCSTWRTPTRIIVLFKEKVLPVLLGRASNHSRKNSQLGETNSVGNCGASVRSNWLWHEVEGTFWFFQASTWGRSEIVLDTIYRIAKAEMD
jgi:hypothetical protein